MTYTFELLEDGTVKSARWDEDDRGYWCTNATGDGIFYVDCQKNDRSQYKGTCDFSVYGLSKSAARAKIRKWMSRGTGAEYDD